MCRWLADGTVEFLGRIDYQVKIRGFRIELGEIENRLLEHEAVKEVIVIDREKHDGEKYLCAYIVLEEERSVGANPVFAQILRGYLSHSLPGYMVPSAFVFLERMPLNPNKKIDRKALPAPDLSTSGGGYQAPRNVLEKELVAIWSAVLELDKEKISIDANFFHSGGHSLKATLLTAKIHRAFGVKLPLAQVFQTPVLRDQAEYIKKQVPGTFGAIEPVEKKEYYVLSPAQKRMYLLHQFDPQGTGYNIPTIFTLEGLPGIDKIEAAFHRLICRHESLRTSFIQVGEEPVQRIHEAANIDFAIEHLKESNGEVTPSSIVQFIRPFDLSQPPLLRVELLKQAGEKYLLIIDMHHIISDGVSMEILMEDFVALYEGANLTPLSIHYKDFSAWQNSDEQRRSVERQERYHLQQLTGEIPVLNLPTDFTRPAQLEFSGDDLRFELGKTETQALQEFAQGEGVTLFMVLFALYSAFLAKLCNQEDIIIGTPLAGRRHADLEQLIGMFINTLAIRAYPQGGLVFRDFLGQVKNTILPAFENQDCRFEELLQQLDLERDSSRNPLFDTMLVLQNFSSNSRAVPGLNLTPYRYQKKQAKFDLMLVAVEKEDGKENNQVRSDNEPAGLSFVFEYRTKLFKESTIHRFSRYFKHVIAQVLANPRLELDNLELITEGEKEEILYSFNDSQCDFPRDTTVLQLFEAQAQRSPGQIAMVDKDYCSAITYQELADRSWQLAKKLAANGIVPGNDSVIAVSVERSPAFVVASLAVWMAGAAYLPIVPHLPKERIDYMMSDSNAQLMITGTGPDNYVNEYEIKNQESKQSGSFPVSCHHSSFIIHHSCTPLAYVIYTSGSTGKPKGVMIEHAQLLNFVFHMYHRFDHDLGLHDKCLSLTEISFDVSVCELFMPLPFGASLVFLAEETRYNGRELAQVIIRQNITFAYIPPSLLPLVSEALHDYTSDNQQLTGALPFNKMLVGVEPIRDEVLEAFLELNPNMRLLNGYGPTETTICATMLTYRSHPPQGQIVPIGSPLSNNQVLILDKGGQLQPLGIPGELCVAGRGVGRGYVNRPGLTARAFAPLDSSGVAPATVPQPGATRMYKTGDLAKWLPGGNISFIGRIDRQVKVRGYRVEPGEIEKLLLQVPGIREARVIVRSDWQEKYLCAYVVYRPGEEPENAAVKEQLAKRLPA